MDGISMLQIYFPIKGTSDLVELIKFEISKENPKLSYISLILGWFEHQLTHVKNKPFLFQDIFPTFEWHVFVTLYHNYLDIINLGFPDPEIAKEQDEEAVIKEVSDFIWKYLSKAFFKDKLHIQSVFSFLTVKQLDCFGIAITILSTLQELGFNDIHLALSEDHAWLRYGAGKTAEVTWHGKGNEEKRGKPIQYGCDVEITHNWLYLGNHSIQCTRHMEIVAIINSLNPTINSKVDSEIIGEIQQTLLWYMFNVGQLDRFPIAICNIADLEEISPSKNAPCTIEELYEKAIQISNTLYNNYYVYPYTYYAGYLYRVGQFDKAILIWTKSAEVVSRYNYSKEDEEVYKEFYEITNTFLPDIAKNNANFFNDEKMYNLFLKYFDYLCQWEAGSKTPIFHEQWAKSFIKVCSTINSEVRSELPKSLLMTSSLKTEYSKTELSCEENKPENLNVTCTDVEVQNVPHSTLKEVTMEPSLFGDEELAIVNGAKMIEIVKILSQSKFNSSAIRLQLCAHTNIDKKKGSDRSVEHDMEPSTKRSRIK